MQADRLENWGFFLLLHRGFFRLVEKVTDLLISCFSRWQARDDRGEFAPRRGRHAELGWRGLGGEAPARLALAGFLQCVCELPRSGERAKAPSPWGFGTFFAEVSHRCTTIRPQFTFAKLSVRGEAALRRGVRTGRGGEMQRPRGRAGAAASRHLLRAVCLEVVGVLWSPAHPCDERRFSSPGACV